jgi:hypothetical protein
MVAPNAAAPEPMIARSYSIITFTHKFTPSVGALLAPVSW